MHSRNEIPRDRVPEGAEQSEAGGLEKERKTASGRRFDKRLV